VLIERSTKNAPARRQSPISRWHAKEANRCHAPLLLIPVSSTIRRRDPSRDLSSFSKR
jgi:hypothetical protein